MSTSHAQRHIPSTAARPVTACNPPCSEEENFELLVENGLMRLSFDTTRTESFRVELAKDQCRR